MTYRSSKILNLNQSLLHQAEPARSRCADRSWAWLAKCGATIRPNKADVPGPKLDDSLVSSAVKSASRHTDIVVVPNVSALSPNKADVTGPKDCDSLVSSAVKKC